MELIFVNEENALKYRAELMKERRKGNLVCLYTDHSRTFAMRNLYSLANVFITSSGAFAFSGCHTLHFRESALIPQVSEILTELQIPYAFMREEPNACGTNLSIQVSPDQDTTEQDYLTTVTCAPEQIPVLQERLEGLAEVKQITEKRASLRFADIRYEDAILSVLKELEIPADHAKVIADESLQLPEEIRRITK